MTTASRLHVAACPAVTKFCESRPSPTMRRDEKIRAFARSVQEITESEEEEESPIMTPRDTVRSPFVLVESPFTQRRCTSLSSPMTTRKNNVPRLARGLSDPGVRRPSFGNQPLSPKFQDDLLGLPPIPEATTPVSPVSQIVEEKEPAQK
ncbi:hypothetical protein Y032_0157g3163 [Ancylostoma ceylanicum]|uniref:Uncharacterized protein n=1 Tax=Ancylostoma ceylanicum TaxID=53326 RepID=A0A016SZ80_9BILA|nr:hypothetical protein Y032_0157g3163 [Ancylostoma ceylanicum]